MTYRKYACGLLVGALCLIGCGDAKKPAETKPDTPAAEKPAAALKSVTLEISGMT